VRPKLAGLVKREVFKRQTEAKKFIRHSRLSTTVGWYQTAPGDLFHLDCASFYRRFEWLKTLGFMPSKGPDVSGSPRRKGLTRRVAQAAAKKSWQNRDLPNWRDRVDDLLKGQQIFVKDLRQWNSIYVAAQRKGVPTLRFKIGSSKFAVVAKGIYDRKVEFIRMGNAYLTRMSELAGLLEAGQRLGVYLEHRQIKEGTSRIIIFSVTAASI
jgi:hypothetical protein